VESREGTSIGRRDPRQLNERDQALLKEIARNDAIGEREQKRTLRTARLANRLDKAAAVAVVVLAAAAGLVALIQDTDAARTVTACLAFASASVAGVSGALDLAKQARVKFAVFNRYSRWRDDLKSLDRDVGYVTYEIANERYAKLLDRRGKIEEFERTETGPSERRVARKKNDAKPR
jgi:hypothetical protein